MIKNVQNVAIWHIFNNKNGILAEKIIELS
jgi:hypothetical protein